MESEMKMEECYSPNNKNEAKTESLKQQIFTKKDTRKTEKRKKDEIKTKVPKKPLVKRLKMFEERKDRFDKVSKRFLLLSLLFIPLTP